MIGAIVLALVALWLALTLAYQYTPVQTALGRIDPFKFIPSWAFFAPRPASRDTQIVVRDLFPDGRFGPWAPVCFFPQRRLLHLLWNPAKRPRKILQDAAKSVKRTRRWARSEGVVQCSLPYLVILHYALRKYRHSIDAVAMQFAIVETSGRDHRRLWMTFLSQLHRL